VFTGALIGLQPLRNELLVNEFIKGEVRRGYTVKKGEINNPRLSLTITTALDIKR
jgi:hypothetical protein